MRIFAKTLYVLIIGIFFNITFNNIVLAWNEYDTPYFNSTFSGFNATGKLLNSRSVYVSETGNVYIADSGNNRIQVFSSNGDFLFKFGQYGTNNGEFITPSDLVVNQNGDIWVVDSGNHRIQIFDSSGNFIQKFGSYGNANGQFNNPSAIALDGLGNIFVVDTNNHRVQKFNSSRVYQSSIGSLGENNSQFYYPASIYIDSTNSIYVADAYNHRIQKFDSNGNFLIKFKTDGINATPPAKAQWSKYNNTVLGISDTTGIDGRIPPGSDAGKADNIGSYDPTVLYINGQYHIYSSAQSYLGPNYWSMTTQLHTSPDGLTWTKFDNNLTTPMYIDTTTTNGRIAMGTSGKGDFERAESPSIIIDDGIYKMWYHGRASGGIMRIFYATSPDGLTWTKYDNTIPVASNNSSTNGRIPLGTNGSGDEQTLSAPSVIKDDGIYKMWYTGKGGNSNRIYYATSQDGLVWTKYDNSIPQNSDTIGTNGRIPLGTNGAGDNVGAYFPFVLKDGKEYKMWYLGNDGSKTRYYYATSQDGLTWYKYDNRVPPNSDSLSTNGRIPLGTASKADSSGMFGRNTVIRMGNQLKMWYSGSSSRTYILHATSEIGEDGFWEEFTPHGISGDSSGNILVTDTLHNRILKYNSNGELLMKFGSLGLGEYQFNTPWGITTDNLGNIFIADSENNRIQKFTYDQTPPTGSISINNGASFSNTVNVTLSLPSTDDIGEVTSMIICNHPSFTDCSWQNYSSSLPWSLINSEGVKTVYVKFKDEVNNESDIFSDSIILDLTSPIGSILINNGDDYTTSTTVVLNLNATDTISSVSEMIICNNPEFSSCKFEPYTTTKEWLLNTSDAIKTAYVKFRDESGNTSLVYSDSITLMIPTTTEIAPEKDPISPPKVAIVPTIIATNSNNSTEATSKIEEIDIPQNTNNTQIIVFIDQNGKPLVNALVEINGKKYYTNNDGEIQAIDLVNGSSYKVLVTFNGKTFESKVLGSKDEKNNVIIKIEEPTKRTTDTEKFKRSYINCKCIISIIVFIILIILLMVLKRRTSSDNNRKIKLRRK